jgi:hypothetical protein
MCYDDMNSRQLIRDGILEEMTIALEEQSGNPGVAEWVCRTMHRLAQIDGVTIKMKAAGLCQTVVMALQRQATSAACSEWGSMAIGHIHYLQPFLFIIIIIIIIVIIIITIVIFVVIIVFAYFFVYLYMYLYL